MRRGSLGGARLASVVPPAMIFLGWMFLGEVAGAQDAQGRFMHLRGEIISPAFEGWWQNEDGSYELFFGYMNTNWEQEFDIPVGPDNYFALTAPGGLDDLEVQAYDPAEADQGQPTHFYPRRNPFLFTIRVPEDFGDRELVWTLKANGRTTRTHGSLAYDYVLDGQVISTEVGGNFGSLDNRLRENVAPELEVEGSRHRTVRVGEPLDVVAVAHDPDDYPPRANRQFPTTPEALYQPATGLVVSGAPGLRLSWIVYRGPARFVTFDPMQLKAWMDSRVYANSPWSPPYVLPEPPPDGRWETRVTFAEPGEYVLRAVASDGSLFTYENVTVTVLP